MLPSVLEPRRRIDRALHAVVMEAYVAGVSSRSVDDLVAALGAESGISKSEVSRICAGLDEMVEAFRGRRLDHVEFPYVYLDATYLKVRNSVAQVASMAMVVATGVTADGNREILGCDIGDSESEGFWQSFLGSLRARGLSGVRLVIADAHAGLAAAADRTIQGAGRQRVPGALHPQPARFGAPHPPAHGRRSVPDRLRAARPRRCATTPGTKSPPSSAPDSPKSQR